MQVGVTGAAGHVGGNLVRTLLEQGHKVRVLIHEDTRAIEGLDVERVVGDVRDPATVARFVAGCERVFHLAALISLDPKDTPKLQEINVGGARNVAEACLAAGVKRLVHFSSIHALSSHPKNEPIDETRPPSSGDALPYDLSKAAGEREVQAVIARGLDAVICNPTAIVGPYDFRPSHVGELLLDLYHRRLPGLVKGGFDWVDVRDVVQGAIAAAERGRRGERYLLSGKRRSVPEFADAAAAATGKKRPWMVTPIWLAHAAAPFATGFAKLAGRRPLFTRASLVALSNHLEVRHDKARTELGYNARPFEETLKDTYAWFEKAGMLAKS